MGEEVKREEKEGVGRGLLLQDQRSFRSMDSSSSVCRCSPTLLPSFFPLLRSLSSIYRTRLIKCPTCPRNRGRKKVTLSDNHFFFFFYKLSMSLATLTFHANSLKSLFVFPSSSFSRAKRRRRKIQLLLFTTLGTNYHFEFICPLCVHVS